MSAAAIADAAQAAPSPKGGKKKLIIIIAALLIVLLAGGAGAVVYMKKKAADAAAAEEAGDDAPAEHKSGKADPAHPPTFLPLDPFVVNLADKDADRFAQVGITLEVADAAFAEQVRAYMPAIRNAILLILAHKTSQELLDRAGKEQLAAEIQRETVRPMGIDVSDKPKKAHADAEADGDDEDKPKKKKKKGALNPIRHVHFSSFIIQ
ncbi:flagellar basal body-associated FliL family protein [Piscinibacter koreensis]|uniref:Flagellar protein FliL n=1 Tax=Piscinibacter koreensis TaxID=2742824 RepID=A0A7Y6NMI2_9BURK|nr:flagellar basal body-associated FliL family protein [Schlegelella koreensis]NUZ05933.1 flagellar basal body-associated FliL family protein [Schlegelella koreensis]